MAQHYSSCSEFIAQSTDVLTVYMFQEDYERIKDWVSNYRNLETGGDLFGLWSSEGRDLKPLIHIVLGPGEGCKRTGYSFFQDVPYLQRVGNSLVNGYMLGHIGEWHSHHGLNLFDPSTGDHNTVKRNYPQGFHGFLLVIANILPNSEVCLSPYMFRERNNMVERGRVVLLAGKSPFRRVDAIKGPIKSGAEGADLSRGRRPVQPSDPTPSEIRANKAIGRRATEAGGPVRLSAPNGQEHPKRNTGVSDATKPEAGKTTQPVKRPLPPAPVAETKQPQWYSRSDGKAKLHNVQQSFERIPGTKNVNMYHDSNDNVCFDLAHKSFVWNVAFPSTYPHGTTVLKCTSQASNTVKHTKRIQGTDCSIMTAIITDIGNTNC